MTSNFGYGDTYIERVLILALGEKKGWHICALNMRSVACRHRHTRLPNINMNLMIIIVIHIEREIKYDFLPFL